MEKKQYTAQKMMILCGLFASSLFIFGCGKQERTETKKYSLFTTQPTPTTKSVSIPTTTETPRIKAQGALIPELDFEVENKTGKTVYVTCFAYIQREQFTNWRWDKSPIYKLNPNEKVIVNVDTIPDDEHREDIYGYLAVFDNENEAHDAIYELVPDTKKIDLDQIAYLKRNNKTVTISVEKYGIKKAVLDFHLTDQRKKKLPHELDFFVENATGKTIFVTGFVYQVEDGLRKVWTFDKTPVLKLHDGEQGIINVDTITKERDRTYMHGYLGVFEEHEEHKAHDATYELLDHKHRITLGRLSRFHSKKVVIEVEQYGSIGEITHYDIQPAAPPKNLYPEPIIKEQSMTTAIPTTKKSGQS